MPKPTTAAPTLALAIIDFASFTDTSTLVLNGSAARSGDVLRLTSTSGVHAGSMWSRAAIDVTRSMTTTFSVRLHDGGGEGLAFVLQSAGLTALGEARGALGYGDVGGTANRISPSVAVEFDVFDNSWDPNTGDNHVAVSVNGAMEGRVAYGIPSFALWSDVTVTGWISYDAATKRLSAYVSRGTTKPSTPVTAATLDLAATLGAGPVFAGFTASNGYFVEAQDVIAWRLTQ